MNVKPIIVQKIAERYKEWTSTSEIVDKVLFLLFRILWFVL